MELIKNLIVKNDAISFEYEISNTTNQITNVGFTEAQIFKFSNPHIGTENDTFFRICVGNVLCNDGDEAFYILLSTTNKKGYYLIKTDSFNNMFVKV
ncbi:MAG: hypothetical protein Q8S41_03090 [Lutibacter sp.]|nr:hypothetical protein [Lutibacter sp.]